MEKLSNAPSDASMTSYLSGSKRIQGSFCDNFVRAAACCRTIQFGEGVMPGMDSAARDQESSIDPRYD